MGEQPHASSGVTVQSIRPMAPTSACRVRADAFISSAFILENASSIGLRSG